MSNPPRTIMVFPSDKHVDAVRGLVKLRGLDKATAILGMDKLTVLKIASGCVPVHPLTVRVVESWCAEQKHAA